METMIVLNWADNDKGYFIFATSVQADRDRFVKRIGEENILSENVTMSKEGKIVHWSLKIKTQAFSKRAFSVRSQRQQVEDARPRSTPRGRRFISPDSGTLRAKRA